MAERRCETCRWWCNPFEHVSVPGVVGTCTRNHSSGAPGIRNHRMWPVTGGGYSCGEWRAAEEGEA